MKVLFPFTYYKPEVCAGIYIIDDILKACADKKIKCFMDVPTPTRNVPKGSTWLRDEYLYDKMVHIHRFHMYKEGKNPISRAFRYSLCEVFHFYYSIKYDYDLIFIDSTPPIQGLKLPLIKLFKKKPIVYNLQDIFPDSLVGTGLAKRGGFLWKIGRYIENLAYKYSDKIIVISEDFKKNIMAKGVPEEKIEVVYNWVDENAIVPIESEHNKLYEELKLDRKTFKVVYAGNLGNAQNVKVLIDSADKCQSFKDIEFVIFGTGGYEKEYKDYVSCKGLSNVKFFPLQPIERVSEVYSLADVSLVSCKKGLGGSAMPSKTWSILSSGTPVICSFDKGGDLQHIVEDNSVGLFSDADDVQSLVDNILILYNNRDLCKEMGLNARNFVISNLTKKIGSYKYAEIIEKIINANKG